MEIGISNNIPTYSGGLGVLAGDTIKSGADLKIPLVHKIRCRPQNTFSCRHSTLKKGLLSPGHRQ